MAGPGRPAALRLLAAAALARHAGALLASPAHGRPADVGALAGGRQLGLEMPALGRLDFTAENATALAEVGVHPRAKNITKGVALEGNCSVAISVNLETGALSLHNAHLTDDVQNEKYGWVTVAWAHYSNTVRRNGWAYLSVGAAADHRLSNELRMYAAGYLEGFVSAKGIRDFQHNANILMQKEEEKHQALGNVREMFGRSLSNILEKAGMSAGAALLDGTAPEDPWWRQARYALLQAWGILDAYNLQVASVNGTAMSMVDLLVLNSDGETPELEVAYDMEETLLRQSQQDERNGFVDDSDGLDAGEGSKASANASAGAGSNASLASGRQGLGAAANASAGGGGRGANASGSAGASVQLHGKLNASAPQGASSTSASSSPTPRPGKPGAAAARHEEGLRGNATAFLQRRVRHHPWSTPEVDRRARREDQLRRLDANAWRRIKSTTGRCSALIRLTGGNKDLMVGHATFSDYSEMTRIFKYYDLPLGDDVVRRMGFSSYPGVAGSTDDYYLLDSGLVVTETTISMLSDEPYDKLNTTQARVPDFMRIMLANRLAKTAPEWAELMRNSATGTYSSQWMVVDYNMFEPGSPLRNGTLVVVEQVPGLTHVEDKSLQLQAKGFWSSENRPWFKDVRDSMGATEAEELHGSLFSADNNPRARIFAGTAPEVQSLASMREEMRRNRWPHEPNVLSEDEAPDHAISARGDLDAERPNPNGAVDAKVTNRCLAQQLRCDTISGPTAASQRPFRWTNASTGADLFPGYPHDGLPDVWNFDWVRMTPLGEQLLSSDECSP